MAASKKSVFVVLTNPVPKKHVVRFDATADDGALSSVYVNKVALATIGDPDTIKVTIEAA